MRGKSVSTTDLIIAMSKFGDKLGHPPTRNEVDAASRSGELASSSTYLNRLGKDEKTGKQSWGIVLESCGMKMPPNRPGRGRKLDDKEKARRFREKQEKKRAREETARKKRIAKFQADKAKAERREQREDPPVPTPTPTPTPTDETKAPENRSGIFGRAEKADTLELINMTGLPVLLTRHKKQEILPCTAKVEFFAETYKFLDDETVNGEINQLFGGVQTRKVVMPFYLVDKNGARHVFPPPKPGRYYLMPRKTAELIASTGRTMDDLIFPVQYQKTKSGVLLIEGVGIKPSKN